jgi:hypothetical protein
MKNILALILAIIFALSLCGCANENASIVCGLGENLDNGGVVSQETTESKEETGSITDSSEKESGPINTSSSINIAEKENKPTNTSSKVKSDKQIEKIVDESHKYLKTGNVVKFYEEKYYEYFTVSGENDGIIVHFKDGTKMGVVEAFKKKLVKLSDLEKYDVKYIKEFAGSQIFDLTEVYNCNVKKKAQEFYKDKNFSYMFSSQKADYVKYVDKKGKTFTVAEALKQGKIKTYDIGNAGVDFDKKYLGKKLLIVDESKGYGTACMITEFYRDETNIYYFSSSKSVVVYYSDGSSEHVSDALAKGKVKIEDLDKFKIGYWSESIEEKKKEIWVRDYTKYKPFPVEQVEEEFYRDDKYIYLFPCRKSQYVEVRFEWERITLPLKEALSSGKTDIDRVLKDMDKGKIEYIKRPIGEE